MLAYIFLRDRRASAVVGLMVLSHWVLDFIVYNNLPLFFAATPTIGLGLSMSGLGFVANIVIEVALVAGGLTVYLVGRRRLVDLSGDHQL
jgi:hypothetical protein